MPLTVHTSIDSIPESLWNEWFGVDYPFLQWRFLRGLETTGCVGGQSGWSPCHLVLRETPDTESTVIAAAPAFLKNHSYGEYVFDWAWADAWERSGLRYYPKLVTAAPFTPATGPRLYLNPSHPNALDILLESLQGFCADKGISGWHLLFGEEALCGQLAERGLHQRMTTQFHWFNRGFSDFDDFLDTFSSRKRKNLRRERRRIVEQGLSLETRSGSDIQPQDWQFFYDCYRMTYAKRSGHGGYLSREFFTELCPTLGQTPVMVLARAGQTPVAAALYFQSADTLYGRYWGCLQEFEYLHFEACYYRGIEYCIEHGLARFDPGAQGEHKIQRGFEPVLTRSNHWVAEAGFDEAVADFCAREREHVNAYREDARNLLPFKQT